MNATDPSSRLARAVTAARRAKGWSKEQAAREAGISAITWKRVEDDLAVQESKLGAIETALGWPAGHAFDLMGPGEDAPDVATVSDDDLLRFARRLREDAERLEQLLGSKSAAEHP